MTPYLDAIMALLPYFIRLADLFIKTDAVNRPQLIKNIQDAIDYAEKTEGDTSKIGEIIRNGK